jgi:site-specific DNA recombinase
MSIPGKRAVIYARYSSKMQTKLSIEGQIMVCRQVAERLGLTVIEVYADAAKSGQKERKREAYQRMLAAARNREFDFIIVEQWNRLSRGHVVTRLWHQFTHWEIKMVDQRGIPATEVDINIASLYNAIYKPQLADFVRRGHVVAVKNGKFPGTPPYGYHRVEGKRGIIEVDLEQAKYIIRIFTEYAAGRSPRAICADLTREGVPAPGGSKVWNHNTLLSGRSGRAGLIANPIYTGLVCWNTTTTVIDPETELDQKRKTPAEQHVQNHQEDLRIVPQELWEAAQKVRSSRAIQKFGPSGKPIRRAVVPRNNEHPLAGSLQCACCNGSMRIANTSRDGAPRAACANAHQRNTCDHTRSFDMDVLLDDVATNIEQRLTRPEAVKAAYEAWKDERKQDQKKQSERSKLESAERSLTTEIERLSHALATSRRRPEELLKLIDDKDAERENIRQRLALLGDPTDPKIVPFSHPKFADVFCGEVKKLVAALRSNPKAIETRLAFKTLVGTVAVNRSQKRMPYRIKVYINSNAFGMKLFAENRKKPAEIAASPWYNNVGAENSERTLSQQGNSLISLGEWQRAA